MGKDMDFLVFCGNSNKQLAEEIVKKLGMRLSDATVTQFSDGEIFVRINESVRGRDVFVIQSSNNPAEKHLMELMIMVDALRRASANSVTAVIPYFGYARQDRTVEPRVPITAKLVANLLTTSGINRMVTMDLHAGQIQGFFDIPVDNLYASPIITKYLIDNGAQGNDYVIVSPDAGGVPRARAYAKILNTSLAIIDKRRTAPNEAKAMHVIGDVKNKHVIIVDDMIDTAGTLTEAANAVLEMGAKSVRACATHAVLSGPAIERIVNSALEEVVVTNTIELSKDKISISKIKVLSVADIFSEAIKRIHKKESISSLFTS
ncbi:ribose-phosphate pyrophosphokinase [Deferribacter desulfuricans SSM1]|uniref:Ribose-phosphate pyrophosphokinase n=1 Tax=Deferribacter desulfuricans (strain DSM 14783 / JCM 11476 / NBRC 101012 / SSM1) TaxID=639282 RepID=D3PBI2_DEFDS|nr:ribose-phosphate pyrophosphokinase [Deferribacter desulfuricans]BAI79955.1 ribose-phosphate pyrophosphokinase [Deferribacter desulfuricans SSM1]